MDILYSLRCIRYFEPRNVYALGDYSTLQKAIDAKNRFTYGEEHWITGDDGTSWTNEYKRMKVYIEYNYVDGDNFEIIW